MKAENEIGKRANVWSQRTDRYEYIWKWTAGGSCEHIGLPGESKMQLAGNPMFSVTAGDEFCKRGIVRIQGTGRYDLL